MTSKITRRGALIGVGAGGAALPASAALYAPKSAVPGPLLLIDQSLGRSESRVLTKADPGVGAQAIGLDLVQQWRGGLKSEIAHHGGAVRAFVRWDKAMILQGLAREEGLRSTLTRIDRSIFQVELSA